MATLQATSQFYLLITYVSLVTLGALLPPSSARPLQRSSLSHTSIWDSWNIISSHTPSPSATTHDPLHEAAVREPPHHRLPWMDVTTLEYYVQVLVGGEDLGVLIPAIDENTTNAFGSTQLFAFNVTQGADPTSTQFGYVRGYTVQASYTTTFHGVEVEVLSYDDGYLNGTVSLQGLINSGTNEIAIVGGTGDFRGARGYGIITQVNSTGSLNLFHHELHFM